MVACSLVNLTTWTQAEPAFHSIRSLWPTPGQLAHADYGLEERLKPLGLWRRRGISLRRLAFSWVVWGPPVDASAVRKYPGLGKYAADSFAIFVEGRTDVRPDDGKLNWFMERLNGRPDFDARTGAEVSS